MSSIEIRVPEGIAQGDSEIVVANWVVEDGGQVDEGDLVCELMVTKVTVEVPSPAAGRLEHKVAEEDIVAIGTLIGAIVT